MGGTGGSAPKAPLTQRETDGIYQWDRREGDRLVGRAVEPEVNEAAKEIRFREISHSDYLLLPEECEFQNYRILIRKIADSTKVGAEAAQRGRVLRGVGAEILGYREQ